MDNLIAFISKFEGIIGALMGVVATLITTQLIKNLGKLYFYFYDYDIKYYGQNEYHIHSEMDDLSKSNSCHYRVRMQLYNSSETIKVLKDMKIEFVLGEKSIINKPNNEENVVKRAGFNDYKDFNFINIPPKELIEIKINGNIHDNNMIKMGNIKKIYFIAKNHKNRTIKKLIKKF
ncbi:MULTISPECIES: hypothetical protein [unclassified Clostridium]|uniref:hypothetical protein n=1 Tax=unclassified Clostridium TaxID=2614128 RepID=UPI00029782BB|nr:MULTISPECIES: hypothetical protein [unclassified Clostridium]EKQ56255.1 MAG: hypothetical protein A370_02011 [Clostridium sp. Maddingley MBC34-26]